MDWNLDIYVLERFFLRLLLLLWFLCVKPVQYFNLSIAARQFHPQCLILPLQLLNNDIPLITPLFNSILNRTRLSRISQCGYRFLNAPITRVDACHKQAVVIPTKRLFQK
jgi:hypothetical protein